MCARGHQPMSKMNWERVKVEERERRARAKEHSQAGRPFFEARPGTRSSRSSGWSATPAVRPLVGRERTPCPICGRRVAAIGLAQHRSSGACKRKLAAPPAATQGRGACGSIEVERKGQPPTPSGPEHVISPGSAGVQFYLWQAEALEEWRKRGHRGVVEAVTGTGKTMVALAAAREALSAGGKVQILVPTLELLRQWVREARRHLSSWAVGELGGGHDSSLIMHDVLVCVVNSARRYAPRSLPSASLLIADECHRYGSSENAKALNPSFGRRLGLSATYARSDYGNEMYLDPFFGPMCFRMGYRRAIDENITAQFKVALIGVRFQPWEESEYSAQSRKASEARLWLVRRRLAPEEPFGEFMKRVTELAEGGAGQATWKAMAFLQAFAEKRRILAETPAKRQKLRDLGAALTAGGRAILFTQTIAAADDAAAVAGRAGLNAESLHSKLDSAERRETLRRFSKGAIKVLAAPQVLDEGIDVPEADLAVILAASRTRRQMIQRMGRVLRRKADGRLARFAIMYVIGTSEDPAFGAHEDFIEEVTSVAREVRSFGPKASPHELCDYLNDFKWSGAVPEPRLAAAVPEPAAAASPGPARMAVAAAIQSPPARTAPSGTGTPSLAAQAQARTKPPKRIRDQEEAGHRGITVDQLLALRRAEHAENLRLHAEARAKGMTVKRLRAMGRA
jgi:superfamily II DNA or RNA helicase